MSPAIHKGISVEGLLRANSLFFLTLVMTLENEESEYAWHPAKDTEGQNTTTLPLIMA